MGPGPLDMSGALADISVEDVLRTVIVEGCIGETVAAMEAKEALTYVTDPTLRYVFSEIARDESQHAMLAWRTVGWLCDTFGERAWPWSATSWTRRAGAGASCGRARCAAIRCSRSASS